MLVKVAVGIVFISEASSGRGLHTTGAAYDRGPKWKVLTDGEPGDLFLKVLETIDVLEKVLEAIDGSDEGGKVGSRPRRKLMTQPEGCRKRLSENQDER